MPEGYENRLVLDEDVPPSLAESLRQRGVDAVALNELRELIYQRRGQEGRSIGDDEVCDEVARVLSVLVTLNVRDYADLAKPDGAFEDWNGSKDRPATKWRRGAPACTSAGATRN